MSDDLVGVHGMHLLEWGLILVVTILAFKRGYREGLAGKRKKPKQPVGR